MDGTIGRMTYLKFYVDLASKRNQTIIINGKISPAQEWVLRISKKDKLPRGKRFDFWR